jgi:hypothetical protein
MFEVSVGITYYEKTIRKNDLAEAADRVDVDGSRRGDAVVVCCKTR